MSTKVSPKIVDRWSAEFFEAHTQYRTTNPAEVLISESLERDKYGRRVRHYGTTAEAHKTLVVVVKMPKVYVEKYGVEKSYLVNDWRINIWDDQYEGLPKDEIPGKIQYARTLKDARALVTRAIAG